MGLAHFLYVLLVGLIKNKIQNMKQFNLKEYLTTSAKVVTRDGRNVRIICTDRKGTDFPIVGLVTTRDFKTEDIIAYTKDGEYLKGALNYDLFFAPEKKEGWINLYKNEDGISWISPNYFTSKKEAEEEGKTYTCSVTTIKIEWEE